MASGILAAAMQAGAILAAPLTVMLLDAMTWRGVLATFALPGLVWAVGFYGWFRDRIEDHPAANAAEIALVQPSRSGEGNRNGRDDAAMPWMRLLGSRAMWMICGQQFFRAAAYVWFASWFATYLQETRGVTRIASGWLTAVPLMASLLASLVSGGLSDWVLIRTGSRTLARKGVAVVSLAICSVLVFQAYFLTDPHLATMSIGAGAFFAACAGPSAYATTIDMGGRHVASVFAVMNMSGNLGAALLATMVPWFRRAVDASPAVLQLFGGNSWNALLVLFGGMYVLAALCWLMLRAEGTVFHNGSDCHCRGETND